MPWTDVTSSSGLPRRNPTTDGGAYEPENATLPFGSAKITVPVEGFTYMPGEQPAIKTLGGNATECADPKEVVVSPATHNVGRHCIYTGGQYDSFLYVPEIPAKK